MDSSAALPKNIRQYEISELLARNGALRVYRALDTRDRHSVMLKTVPLDLGNRDVAAAIAQLKKEAQVSSALRHPGILQVFEYGEDEGLAYLALEFAEGCFLKPKLRLPIVDSGSGITQLLGALDYAHQQSVLHLGIHPGCLLLNSKGQLRVTDFGVRNMQGEASAYSAPEVLAGAEIDARADIFSVGAWFYELLTGVSAFSDPPPGQNGQQLRPPSAANRSVPEVLDSVCLKAIAGSPSDRYPSAQAFLNEVRSAYEAGLGAPPNEQLSNEVVVSVFLSSLRGGARASRSKQQVTPSPAKPEAPHPQSSNTVWSDQALRTIEKQLARHIGPVARVVVKNAAARSKNVEDLYQIAAESLGTDQERRAFLEGRVSDEAMRAAIPAPQIRPGSEEPTVGNHESVPIVRSTKPPANAARPVAPPPVQPPVSVPEVSSVPKPKPSAPAQSSQQQADPQMVERLEQLLGKQPESFAGYLTEEPADVDHVIYAFISATEALVRLYAEGGKTGGLAPQNIRFDRLGKATIQASPPNSTSLQGATSFGSMGSPRYAAPEMFKETNTGTNAPALLPDIYAMGFMFYEILLGKKLFRQTFSAQRSDLDWLRWHSDGKMKAPAAKSLLPGRPAALSDLIQAMIEKDPGARASDLKDIIARLRSIAQQSSRTVVSGKPPAPVRAATESAQRRGFPWLTAAVIVVALLLAALLIWQMPAFRQWMSTAPGQPTGVSSQD